MTQIAVFTSSLLLGDHALHIYKNGIMAVRVQCFGLFPFSGTSRNIVLFQSLNLSMGYWILLTLDGVEKICM